MTAPHPIKTFQVPTLTSPLRLDKYLVEIFPHSSRAFWKEHLLQNVRINGLKPKAGQRLLGGEILSVASPPDEKHFILAPNLQRSLNILYQDDYLLAVDKPAGLPCHPLKAEESDTAVHAVAALDPQQLENFPDSREIGLLHRLDNETSGVLLFARTPETKTKLMAIQRQGGLRKTYLAWVAGRLEHGGKIQIPLAHHPKNKKKMRACVDEKEARKLKARDALTYYTPLKSSLHHSLVQVEIYQGARHQIRVHLASLGHPLLGDPLYGGPPSHRLLLHASQIDLRHPHTGKLLNIHAAPPQDFRPHFL